MFTRAGLLMVGDMLVVISLISRIYRLNLLKMLIEVGLHACIHRMSVLVFVLLCFAKENHC